MLQYSGYIDENHKLLIFDEIEKLEKAKIKG